MKYNFALYLWESAAYLVIQFGQPQHAGGDGSNNGQLKSPIPRYHSLPHSVGARAAEPRAGGLRGKPYAVTAKLTARIKMVRICRVLFHQHGGMRDLSERATFIFGERKGEIQT